MTKAKEELQDKGQQQVPAGSETSVEGGKGKLVDDLRKLVIYHEIMRPKFDE